MALKMVTTPFSFQRNNDFHFVRSVLWLQNMTIKGFPGLYSVILKMPVGDNVSVPWLLRGFGIAELKNRNKKFKFKHGFYEFFQGKTD